MSDSEIILKYLTKSYPDDHQCVYLYVCGHRRSTKTSVDHIMRDIKILFCPPISEHYVNTVIEGFLENKKKMHMKGLIKVKPIYNT